MKITNKVNEINDFQVSRRQCEKAVFHFPLFHTYARVIFLNKHANPKRPCLPHCNTMTISPSRSFTLLGFIALAIWSVTPGMVRVLGERLGPYSAGAAVYLAGGAAGLTLQAFLLPHGLRVYRSFSWKYLVVCGSLFALYMPCIYQALTSAASRHQALEVALINYLWPTFILLFSMPILSTRPTMLLLPGVLLACSGVIVALSSGLDLSAAAARVTHNPFPYGLAFICALTWGLYSNFSRKYAAQAQGSAVFLFMAVAGIVLLVLRWRAAENPVFSASTLALAGLMAVLTVTAYLFFELAMRKGDMVLVASASYFTPILATCVSGLYLNTPPGLRFMIGAACITFAAWICRKAFR
ncbi:MAG: hypothetical protein A2268_04645 [Candidatus Raymondbacteria bacterium RifOxyA12_full_50_37]|uniref:EamA domain-containing protein n=1 Tax=Candidatus Raymondbacteria bacterium RIFOXYD12_FULL_49_13 TaxID=1817890 RepID=A0A1F7FDJ7_UNCRA|nr:MAG: hypothetical protein A2268_04645 [Candidatus Raymondbacteria bacterium RifOxyA12_full_50_37]OGJ94040.1 MAG: hypothetical protein A2248_11850 [Candidatus Raymondbacteria bacterium RIFOXYA2_FULL_49_16]OGJ96865.1 MAG: hypothetical protein A2453_04450 [Candidatus Raymondbacteria bacterium RIFOXYC2_FULL_50_21]OGJ97484.1 MAG: hypothetical protein A2487_12825 [Candidatus Raymondbacteria bacterium RifOxyC12_full_50_8]OGK04592.1 MAG: hypothetical protein A2519_20620 [Candidatus Raymondbacteria b